MPKKKPKIAKLEQSTKKKSVIINLSDDEVGILTGEMGGCCSVILLWNPDKKGTYQNVRGQHADADPENLDWDELVKDVPNDLKKAKMIVLCGPDNFRKHPNIKHFDDYPKRVKEKLKTIKFQDKKTKAMQFFGIYQDGEKLQLVAIHKKSYKLLYFSTLSLNSPIVFPNKNFLHKKLFITGILDERN